jgi:integrase
LEPFAANGTVRLRLTNPVAPFYRRGFRAGAEAKIGFKVHPHMLRHACGYALANKGIDTRTLQAYLGHRSINSTTRYAALAPGRFKNIWGKGKGRSPSAPFGHGRARTPGRCN